MIASRFMCNNQATGLFILLGVLYYIGIGLVISWTPKHFSYSFYCVSTPGHQRTLGALRLSNPFMVHLRCLAARLVPEDALTKSEGAIFTVFLVWVLGWTRFPIAKTKESENQITRLLQPGPLITLNHKCCEMLWVLQSLDVSRRWMMFS